MLAKESGGSTFDLPEEVFRVLPSDPFDQLDVARKITSIALSTRVSSLEAESSSLKHQFAEKDQHIADLFSQIDALETSLSEPRISSKLQRDVSKLEVFRRKLMQSLQDDEESPGAPIVAKTTPSGLASPPPLFRLAHLDASTLIREIRMQRIVTQMGTITVSASRPDIPHGLLLASQMSTRRITHPGTPPSVSASVSPTRTSKPVSPRRHSVSFSTSRGIFDDRSSQYQAPIPDHRLVALGLMEKSFSVRSGAACLMSSLVHS
ncbi:putative prolyl 4-hydroxylase alpha subunit [Hibiscus syriacus]|uniref:Prolyl 4-hydroxylase alpha subunit n=1 Tax=Hibiscus syriacus TaxID=106335 RepID=A0A6A3C9L3_HIBSY|nr:putative prolyl 4-hydroxylase alpha subunit [Hibiscus syriacus]